MEAGVDDGSHEAGSLLKDLAQAAEGAGPLLQRDYWAVIASSALSPSQLITLVARRFREFAPEELVVFRRSDDRDEALELGDELDVHIVGTGACRVRVTHKDAQSLTLATISGHPESGRITFGAYRNPRGDVLFHIRSRARSRSPLVYLGFRILGDAMQHNTWAEFVNRVANTAGAGVIGAIRTETKTLKPAEEEPAAAASTPTFLARKD